METPCDQCKRLRGKIDEAAKTNARSAEIWKDTPPPRSDALLGLLNLNLQVQAIALNEYVSHIRVAHGRLGADPFSLNCTVNPKETTNQALANGIDVPRKELQE